VEENGSTLTMLSALARLDQDPWAAAARWARLPRAAAATHVATLILQMPLRHQALADAPQIAVRLSQLLPRTTEPVSGTKPERATVILVIVGLCVGLSVGVLFAASTVAIHGVSSSPQLSKTTP